MGNEHSRAKHKKGYLACQTAKPYYYPGEMVNGTIYLRTFEHMEARHIMIKVKGQEKTKWYDEVTRHEENEVKHELEKRHSDKKIFEFSAPVFTFATPVLEPGDYAIPFAFQLPSHLPSSILFKRDTRRKPKAKVKYTIKTVLNCQDSHDEMKYKQVLIVREAASSHESSIKQTSENNITTWCCMSQGVSKLECTFDKNTFTPVESCGATVQIDNSSCNVALTGIRIAVEQEIRMSAGGHHYHENITLIDRELPGVEANYQDKVDKVLTLNLADLKYHVQTTKKKKGVQKTVSLED